jgi:hypothetical protein
VSTHLKNCAFSISPAPHFEITRLTTDFVNLGIWTCILDLSSLVWWQPLNENDRKEWQNVAKQVERMHPSMLSIEERRKQYYKSKK